MKINESFEIRVNILKILRNQTLKNVTIYPKAGVGCYTTRGKLLHFMIKVLSRQFGPARHGTSFKCVCGDM